MKTLDEIIYDLVERIFKKHRVNVYPIKIDDYDLDRVYINNDEYTLRMWNIYRDGVIEYTLFKSDFENNCGIDIARGRTRSSRRLVRLLQEDAERRYIEYEQAHHD